MRWYIIGNSLIFSLFFTVYRCIDIFAVLCAQFTDRHLFVFLDAFSSAPISGGLVPGLLMLTHLHERPFDLLFLPFVLKHFFPFFCIFLRRDSVLETRFRCATK